MLNEDRAAPAATAVPGVTSAVDLPGAENVVTQVDRASLDNTVAVMDLGAVGFNPRGQYSDGNEYRRLDIVMYAGAGWICLKDGTSGIEPVDGDNWMKFANNGSEDLLEQTKAAMEAAKTAQTGAETAQTAAETAAENAATSASEAADSAAAAKQDAETAATKAGEASASAVEAGKAQTAAETAKTGAETAAGNAEASASAASGSATEAAEAAAAAAKEAAEAIQDHPPQINKESNTWETYSVSQGEYVDTGVYAGVDLQAGNGVKVEKTEHGAKISLPVWLGFDEDGKFCINEEDEV